MPLSLEQFKQQRAQGLTTQQISEFERREPTPKKVGIFERISRVLLPKGVEKFAETLGGATATLSREYKEAVKGQAGLDAYNQKLATAIIFGKRVGRDTSRMEQLYQRNTGQRLELKDIIGEVAEKTTRQIAGEALATVGTMALGASGFGKIGGRLMFGGGLGATFGISEALIANESAMNVVTSGLSGAVIGLALSGLLEGVAKVTKAIIPRIGKYTYTKELQPPMKKLISQVEAGFRTFGEKVRSIKDINGNAVYKGTYTTMRKQAKDQLNKQGKALMSLAKDYDDVISVNRNQIAGDIVEQLQNVFSRLKRSQLEIIKFEVSRMPTKMNATEMIKNKRVYDKIIPDSFWLKAGDANVAFATQVKYILRDNLRKMLNSRIDDDLLKKLNNELSIAMDVKHLTSKEISIRMERKISGEGGFYYKLIGRFIDDWLLNPAITTRASQATLRAGKKVGVTPIRAATRALLIKEAVE